MKRTVYRLNTAFLNLLTNLKKTLKKFINNILVGNIYSVKIGTSKKSLMLLSKFAIIQKNLI